MTTDNVRVLKTGTCPSLSGKSKLTYEIGSGAAAEICVRITKNTGGGMFGKGWVALDQVHRLVNDERGWLRGLDYVKETVRVHDASERTLPTRLVAERIQLVQPSDEKAASVSRPKEQARQGVR